MAPRTLLTAALLPIAFALPLAGCSASAPATSSAAAPASASATVASPSAAASTPTPSASVTPTPSPKPSASGYPLSEVRKHASASSCWSVVDGKVYDLTKWIGRHPGGRARIIAMCGKDGTATFHGEHGRERGPNNDLKRSLIGPLAPA